MSRSRKPDANTPTKYEQALPSYVEDFFVYYLKSQEEPEALEDWQASLVNELVDGVISMIQTQWKESSRTRRMFVPMNPDVVWDNQAEKIMKLTRRNLATFDQGFMSSVDTYIQDTLKNLITPIREEISAIIVSVSASQEEDAAVQGFCSGDTFYFEDLAQHLVEQDAWQGELFQRIPVIEYVRKRERFLLEMIKFEESTHNSSSKNAAIGSHNANAKYRANAAKTLRECTAEVKRLVDEYQSTYEKAFEIKGVVYQHKIEAQDECEANVKTNFSAYHRGFFVFLNEESDTIEDAVIPGPAAALLSDESKYQEPGFVDYTQ